MGQANRVHQGASVAANSFIDSRKMAIRTAASLAVPASVAIAAPSGPSSGTNTSAVTTTTTSEQTSAAKLALGRSIAHRPLPATTPTLLANTLSDKTPTINPAPANCGP